MSSPKKLVLLYPGQGSQYVSMGSNLPAEFQQCFDQASEALGFDLKNLCFEGPEEELNLTKNTQPALLTHSIALTRLLFSEIDQKYIKYVIGHSIGEYSALCAANTFDLGTAVNLVHNRGIFMQEAVAPGDGAMVALLKVKEEIISQIINSLRQTYDKFSVQIANFNSEQQIVVSGLKTDCDQFVKCLDEAMETPYKAIPLKVSAPFHCQLMMPAQERMESLLNQTQFNQNTFDYIANIDAQVYLAGTEEKTIKQNLVKQISGSVLFYPSLKHFDENNIYVEVGPGKVLSNILRKYNRSFKTFALDGSDLSATIHEIKGLLHE